MEIIHWNSDTYFPYKGKHYMQNTEVIISDSFIKTHIDPTHNKPLWKEARFHRRVKYGSGICVNYLFFRKYRDFSWFREHGFTKKEYENTAFYFILKEEEIEKAIEDIIAPIEVEVTKPYKIKDWQDSVIIAGWIIYIVLLFFSLVFKQWYYLWLWLSIIFFIFRARALWK